MAISGAASLFYEGWGQPIPRVLGYLAPAVLLIVLGLIALRRPAPGGTLLLVAAAGAGAWWVRSRVAREVAPLDVLLATALVTYAPIIVAALLFLLEARHRRLLRAEGARARRGLLRRWREALLVAIPALAVAVLSARQLPALLARHDDGQRGSRVIAGNGITLTWAPLGPGWNWQTPHSEYPSWHSLANYGDPPAERCAYLNEDGSALLAAPAGIWRMPTADEIARSLTRGGENAECAWDGRSHHSACRTPPDKETPLWAPDQAPIYYWSSEGPDRATAFAVNYTGGISTLPRARANSAVGFRCVKAAGGPSR